MKIKKLLYLLFIVCAAPSIVTSYAYAQASVTNGETVISPPAGGSEEIAVPQSENVEILPVPPQNAGNIQTATVIQPQQPPENLTPLSGSTPTISEQPLMPLPEGAVSAMPLTNVSEGLQISPTIQPLSPPVPSWEQQPASEMPQAGQQPSAELPALPEQNITSSTLQVTTIPEEEKVTKPPHIVPGEVLSGMPAYVNVRTSHIVKPGEDLHWIAAVYYGDARLWKKIYEANKSVIKDPNHLVVGTKLIIPPK